MTMTAIKKSSAKAAADTEKYFQGIGRRKLSVTRVKIFELPKKKETSKDFEILINGKPYKIYFSLAELRGIVTAPLKAVSPNDISRIVITARGGGIRGQAEAARLGIARALVLKNQGFKKTLKDQGFLTRDARVVERKKAGLKKARRAPQFSKR